jgi:hypothetical protein
MKPMTFVRFAAMAVAILAAPDLIAARAQQQPPALPTMPDLKQMYESGEYKTCLQQLSRLMPLRAENPNFVPKDQLQLLRGQCLLALEDPASALRALDQAKDSKDQETSMHARALTALIRKSPRLRYVPKSGGNGGEGVNIADPKTRRQAFAAYFADEFDSLRADAQKAVAANNLNPSIALVPRLVELSTAERIATGGNERVGPIGKEVGEHARELINAELDMQEGKIGKIERYANQLINNGGPWSGISRQGLDSNQRQDLYDLIQYLSRVVDTSENALRVAQGIQGNVQAWEGVLNRAQALRDHAQEVLDAEGFRSGGGDTSGIGKNG